MANEIPEERVDKFIEKIQSANPDIGGPALNDGELYLENEIDTSNMYKSRDIGLIGDEGFPYHYVSPKATPKPTVLESAKAVEERENIFSSAFKDLENERLTQQELLTQKDFKQIDEEWLNSKPVSWRRKLVLARTDGERARLETQLQDRENSLRIIDQTSWHTLLPLYYGVYKVNPVFGVADAVISAATRGIIPLGALSGLSASARVATNNALKILKKGAGFALSESVNEIAMHRVQQARTLEDSLGNIAGAAVFGVGIQSLGSSYRMFTNAQFHKIAQKLNPNSDIHDVVTKDGETIGINIYDKSQSDSKFNRVDLNEKLADTRDNIAHFEMEKQAVESTIVGAGEPFADLSGNPQIQDYEGPTFLGIVGDKIVGAQGISPAYPIIKLSQWAQNPYIKGLYSKSSTVNNFFSTATTSTLDTVNAIAGRNIAGTMQDRIEISQIAQAKRFINLRNDYYNEYLKSGVSDKVKLPEFDKQVILSIVEDEPSKISQANAYGKILKDEFYAPITQKLIELKLLPEDVSVKAAVNYINRLYDREFIRRNKTETIQFVESQYLKTNDRLVYEQANLKSIESRIVSIENEIKGAAEKERIILEQKLHDLERMHAQEDARLRDNMDRGLYSDDMIVKDDFGNWTFRAIRSLDDIKNSADLTVNRLIGNAESDLYSKMVAYNPEKGSSASVLHSRDLMISDSDMYRFGMLSSNLDNIISTYAKKTSTLIQTKEYLKSIGNEADLSPKKFFDAGIRRDYKALEEKLAADYEKKIVGKTNEQIEKLKKKREKEQNNLTKAEANDKELIAAMWNKLTGERVPDGKLLKFLKNVRGYEFATRLGRIGLWGLQDIVAPIFSSGLKSYAHGVQDYAVLLANKAKSNPAFKKDLDYMLIGLEVKNSVFGLQHGGDSAYVDYTNTTIKKLGQVMGLTSVTAPVVDLSKSIAWYTNVRKMLNDLDAFNSNRIAKNDLINFAKIGLADKAIAHDVSKMIKQYGELVDGVQLLNIANWGAGLKDAELSKAIKAREAVVIAMNRKINGTIFSGANIANYPIFLDQTGVGGIALAYLGYSINATSAFLIPLLQRLDPHKVQGLVAMYSMSVLRATIVEALKDDPDYEYQNLLVEGIVGLNAAGVLPEAWRMLSGESSRFGGGAFPIIGVPYRVGKDIANVITDPLLDRSSRQTLESFERLLPIINSLPFEPLVDAFNEWLTYNQGLPDTRREAKKRNG